ncbi:unnamed protein product [Merluccius merluccius]
MESQLNCSSHCDSPLCLVHPGVNKQDALDILQKLCTLSTASVERPKRALSPVLCAVVWTLLSCGILLAFCFLFFTLRFKNNRIVKMSSPNLNVLTLMGSVLTYTSGFLFSVDELWPGGGASTSVIQARTWTLCVGSTLVFGPILGKTWRLYRVFTQRVPDKRVIIRDIQLMGLVGLLILVDVLVLAAWNLADPVRCSRSVGAVVKVVENDMSFSLTHLDSCSSVYSDLWVILIAVLKGTLLLYGTYLAGLTSNVSHPPVNQSPTIITAVSLATLSSAVAVPVSIFLQAWPNLVYSTVAGAIFICTLATNCLLFVPQLTQCRQFEEEHSNPSQMAKYFSSPSKSQTSSYSQDEIYYLLGENNSMKKLLNEKNAVIDSLQEQVNNAKDKLLRLMTSSQPRRVDHDLDSSSATNLNSSSTQTTVLAAPSDGPPTPPPPRGDPPPSSLPALSPGPATASPAVVPLLPKTADPAPPVPAPAGPLSPPLPLERSGGLQRAVSRVSSAGSDARDSRVGGRGYDTPASPQHAGGSATTPGEPSASPSDPVSPPPALDVSDGFRAGTGGCLGDRASQLPSPGVSHAGFISSEQLQEILQELSVEAAMETALSGQARTSGRLSQPGGYADASLLSPLSLPTPWSPHPRPVLFSFPSISPYAMRKRRPPFHSPRGGQSPCFFPGPEPGGPGPGPGSGKRQGCPRTRPRDREKPLCTSPSQTDRVSTTYAPPHPLDNSDIEEQEEEEAKQRTAGERRGVKRRAPARHRRACRHSAAVPRGATAPSDAESAGGEACRRSKRATGDSYGSWDTDSSSSADYCYYHRPYCDSCLQRGSLLSSETSSSSSSDTSDSEYGRYAGLYRSPHPVVFKEDLKPTFV